MVVRVHGVHVAPVRFRAARLDAEVVKLVYTQRSERCGGNPMEVQVLSSAPATLF